MIRIGSIPEGAALGTVSATGAARRAACAVLLALAALSAASGRTAPPAAPERGLEALDEAFAASARDLVRRAEREGCAALAALIGGWELPPEAGRQLVLAIPPRVERPAAADAPGAGPIWDDFLAARRSRAAGTFAHALVAAAAHDAVPTRAERARPRDPDAAPVASRSAEALRLLHRTLWDDPDHARARAAGGWVRHDDAWVSPEAARRLERGEQFDAAFGWLPAAKLARYRAGERFDRGKWVTAAADEARPREVKQGRELHSDHWDVVATAPLAAAAGLAARLEETRAAWLQVFGGCAVDADELEKRFAGRGRTPPRTPHAAVLCATRRQYVAELEPLEPAIGRTNGIYWAPTRTAWFFDEPAVVVAGEENAGGGLEAFTVHHEATHQLFAESRPAAVPAAVAAAVAGERCGFWAVEAVACYMETLAPMPHGWTVGGLDAGRVPAARQRLLEEGDYVPLAELTALGRAALQTDDRLTWIYSQAAGLADFLMNGRGGRYREAFLAYLARVYAGTADPDTLARLCGRSYVELDEEYRRHLAR